jgi:phage terminase small subunit
MANIKGLTLKQEGFCQDYILTGNASEAYRRNYDACRCSESTVNRKAKELIDNGKVAARIIALQAEVKKKFDITVEQKMEWLQQVVEAGLEALEDGKRVGLNATVSAIAELNRMSGDHAPAKHSVGTEDGLTVLLGMIKPTLGPPSARR